MTLQIRRHDTSDLVELSDGSRWRIFPADVPATLGWSSSTEFDISDTADEMWSHVLVNRDENSAIRVIVDSKKWPKDKLQRWLRKG